MKVMILGGGLAGMAAANKLVKENEVTIIEKERDLGGLAGSFKQDGYEIPLYYHHVFWHDKITKRYLDKYGLLDSIKWTKINMGICVNKKVNDFTNPLSLLKLDCLSLLGRLRYGLFGFYGLFLMNPEKIPDDKDCKSWLEKYAGKEVTERIFKHLYAENKFDTPLEELSAKQLAYRLAEREAIGKFGYPKEGLDEFVKRFEKDLIKKGVKIRKQVIVKKIDLKNKIFFHDNKKEKYDKLINTIPTPVFIKLSKGLPSEYKQRISQVKYTPVITVNFGTDEFLSKHYWLNVFNERIGMIMQHSNIFDNYEGFKVNYALRYGGSAADLNLSDKQISDAYLKVVKKYFPNISVKWVKVFRNIYAEPIYDKWYSSYQPHYDSPVDGLYNAGTAVFFPKIRTMNFSLESGEIVAEKILNSF